MKTIQAQIAELLRTTEDKVDARIMGLKIGDPCSRCGGCGEYSFNPTDGTRCFKCHGKGNIPPKSDAAWKRCLKRAQELQPEALDAYIEQLRTERRAKNATERFFAAWKAAEDFIQPDWRASIGAPEGSDLRNRSNSMKTIKEAFDVLQAAVYAKDAAKTVEALTSGLNIIEVELKKYQVTA